MRISIKYKLLALLIALSMITLVTYATIVLRAFTNDKITYVYDTILLNSRSVANLIRAEISHGTTRIQSAMNYYSANSRTFTADGEKLFKSDSLWKKLTVYQFDSKSGSYVFAKELLKSGAIHEDDPNLVRAVLERGLSVKALPDDTGDWLMGVKVKSGSDSEGLVVLAQFAQSNFVDAFFKPQVQNIYLTGDRGDILLSPKHQAHFVDSSSLSHEISEMPKDPSKPYGVINASRDGLLMSFADVGIFGLRVVSVVPKSVALSAASLIQRQSVLFLISLLGIAVFVSVLGASGLTTSLKRLHSATVEISRGNLEIQLKAKGKDEIADVSRSFNSMVGEIKRLLKETAEKVRMEGELKTASLVQSTLFPRPALDSGRLQLRGFYQPASECSGDWWNFAEIGTKVYIIICDATGHGVPAALMTSAARSAFSVVVDLPNMSVERCLEFLNRALFDTAKGEMQMTSLVMCIDRETGELSYASAGHEMPYVFRKKDHPLTRKEIDSLDGEPSVRIGENRDSTYKSHLTRLNSGECIVFFTDGLSELHNAEGKELGSRKLLDRLVKSFNENANADQMMEEIASTAATHRGTTPLADDMTYLVLKIV